MSASKDILRVETVIVGGGIAGLACGRRLWQAGHRFALVTDRLGGRMLVSQAGLNLGAAYVTPDYKHVRPFVDLDHRIWLKDVLYFDGARFISVFHPANTRRLPALMRLYRLVWQFRGALQRLREGAPTQCQKALMERDPLLSRYVALPAADLIAEHGLEEVNAIFCGPVFHSTLFVPWERANAFYWLANLFPILLPTYGVDLRRTVPRLCGPWRDRVVLGKATAITERDGGAAFEVETPAGRIRADNLVLALPCRNAEGLYPMTCSAEDVPYCTLHVAGRRRPDYQPGKTVFLGPSHPVRVLWPQRDGTDILYSGSLTPDLSPYYEAPRTVASVRWETAVQLSGARWRPLQPRPNVFTIGDHNIVGLEDSYLTGLFAANRILGAA